MAIRSPWFELGLLIASAVGITVSFVFLPQLWLVVLSAQEALVEDSEAAPGLALAVASALAREVAMDLVVVSLEVPAARPSLPAT